MRIAVLIETDEVEARVAATPETVKKYVGLGAEVAVEAGAGTKAGIPDAEYAAAGAEIAPGARETLAGADIVLTCAVRRPAALAGVKPGALVIAIMDPYGAEAALQELAGAGVTAFAMELMPRITRAQVDGRPVQRRPTSPATAPSSRPPPPMGRALPMMMTAAGTSRPRACS